MGIVYRGDKVEVVKASKTVDVAGELNFLALGDMCYTMLGTHDDNKIRSYMQSLFEMPGNRFSHDYSYVLMDDQIAMGMMTCLPVKVLNRATLKTIIDIIKLRKLSALKIIVKHPKSLLALMRMREGKENEYHISMIATLPEFQGKCVAKRLIAHAEEMSIEEGFNKLSLTVVKQNEAAFQLYKKLDFNVVGTIDDNTLHLYRMRKLLTVNRED